MQITRSFKTHNLVDYYPLPNGMVDVFLHKNETTEVDEDDNIIYIAEEIYFQVDASITKEQIEQNFDHIWENGGILRHIEPTPEDRLKAMEDAILFIMTGGGNLDV